MFRVPRPIGTVKFLLAWLMPWRPAFLVRAEPSKLQFFVHWRDALARHVAKYGSHEPDLTAWFASRLQESPKGLIIDVGANVGWYTIHAVQHQAVETVVAFEPDAFNAWLLERNLALNRVDNVVVQCSAVGAQRGTARLYRYKPSNCGRHSVLTDYGLGSRLVPMTDLDSALDDLGLSGRRVLILKIDVEGYEPAVIEGAKRTLKHTDAVMLEYAPQLVQAGGLSVGTMIDCLCAHGFAPHRLESGGRLAAVSAADVRRNATQVDLIWIRVDDATRSRDGQSG